MKQYPLVEEFTSVQGEGVWTGTMMRFVRLAGCNVGKYSSVAETKLIADEVDLPIIYPREGTIPTHSVCCTVLDQEFICDTDYRGRYKKTIEEILQDAEHIPRICLTGGEPFLHDVKSIWTACLSKGKQLHVETSGTLDMKPMFEKIDAPIWITCAPKKGFLPGNARFVSEWKFVLGTRGLPEEIDDFFSGIGHGVAKARVFVQPVNGIHHVDEKSLERVLAIIKERPEWRLSVQLHKYLEVQ